MASLADSLRAVDRRYREDHRLDLGLARLLPDEETDVASWLEKTQPRLEELGRSLRSARKEVTRLAAVAEHVRRILPFTPEGWPARKRELEQQLAADVRGGLREWLSDWCRAAAAGRLDALERLREAGESFPAAAELILERAQSAEAGLRRCDWHLSSPMLSAAKQLTLDGHAVVTPATAREIDLLLARLAIETGLREEATAALAHLKEEPDGEVGSDSPRIVADVEVLKARIVRETDADAADRALQRAQTDDPENLELAVELVIDAERQEKPELALETARSAIEARLSLSDVVAELARTARTIPTEIWLAVAERAAREGDSDTVLDAAARALERLPPDDEQSRASVIELRADALARREADGGDVAATWVRAGDARVGAGQFELGRANYEQALRHDAGNIDAKLGLADCLRLTNVEPPSSPSSSSTLARAHALVDEAIAAAPMTAENSWGYLVKASLCDAEAASVSPDRPQLLTRALALVCSATAYRPELSARWVRLANAATDVGLPRAALAFAERAIASSNDSDSLAACVVANANAGRTQEALDLISDRAEEWIPAVRATLILHQGRASESLKIIESATPGPYRSATRIVRMQALALSDRWDDARSAAAEVLGELGFEPEDYNDLTDTVFATIFFGSAVDAEAGIARLEHGGATAFRESTIAVLKAMTALMQGEREQCAHELRRMVDAIWATSDCVEWSNVLRPLLDGIARRCGVEPPDLGEIDTLVEQRAQTLAEIESGEELAHARLHAAETSRPTLRVLLPWAEGALDAASEALEREARSGESDELTVLRERLQEAIRNAERERLAERAVELAQTDVEAARDALKLLLEQAGDEAWLFFGDWPDDRLEPVLTLIRSALASPGFGEPAATLLWNVAPAFAREHDVPRAGHDDAGLIQLELPPSWFTDYDDPEREHPLFLRYLPEARTRASFPPVTVGLDDELEPDRYRISFSGEVLDEGAADPTRRYCRAESLELLPDRLSERAQAQPGDTGLVSLPQDALADLGGLAELTTMPAVEVVARAVTAAGQKVAQPRLEGAV